MPIVKRHRSRGRPRKNLVEGPTPYLLAKGRGKDAQKIAKGWWHLFYENGHISHPDFILSQDFATLRHWAKKVNSHQKPWMSPLGRGFTTIPPLWREEDQMSLSQWWHRLLREPGLSPWWPIINHIYESPIPAPYTNSYYRHSLNQGQSCLKKIATYWVSRYDFIELRDTIRTSD